MLPRNAGLQLNIQGGGGFEKNSMEHGAQLLLQLSESVCRNTGTFTPWENQLSEESFTGCFRLRPHFHLLGKSRKISAMV